jgi:hypothetical protein
VTWRNQGPIEAKQYAEWMDKYHPLPDNRTWKDRVVYYDLETVRTFLRDIGYFE